MRLFALSDIHVDHPVNHRWLNDLSSTEYERDVLLLAGDVTDNLDRLEVALAAFRKVFARVFFVPGNHELWIRKRECADSMEKFRRVLDACTAVGVETAPARLGDGVAAVWVVPLFSWYEKPEEGEGSLFLPKPGEDASLSMWADEWFTSWPPRDGDETVATAFLAMNEPNLRAYDAPVVSFSHFLPRQDLIFMTDAERVAGEIELPDPYPTFNFSRAAGCTGLERQIRRLESAVHVYGHQHRNRHRNVDGVTYVSHCLDVLWDLARRQEGVTIAPREIRSLSTG